MTLGQTIRIRPTTTGRDFDSALERMAENDSMNSLVVVPIGVVEATLSELKSAGRQASERFVLWLGRPTEGIIQIETIWVPEQESGFDFFKIPEHAMQALLVELRKLRLMVAAQVHTHPGRAFHSRADDRGAIIRHTGALSLVLPCFGLVLSSAMQPCLYCLAQISGSTWTRLK